MYSLFTLFLIGICYYVFMLVIYIGMGFEFCILTKDEMIIYKALAHKIWSIGCKDDLW